MNTKFYNKAREAVGGLYAWGGQGHAATESYIRGRAKKYPEYFDRGRLEMMLARVKEDPSLRGWDCSGLVCWALEELGLVKKGFDTTADGLYRSHCTQITRAELHAGDLLFRKSGSKMVHVGIYAPGACVEAAGGEYGVVECKGLSGSDHAAWSYTDKKTERLPDWTHYGRLKVLAQYGAPDKPQGEEVLVLDNVNIRDKPDTGGHLVSIARKGEIYPLIAVASTGWYKIGEGRYISNRADLTKLI